MAQASGRGVGVTPYQGWGITCLGPQPLRLVEDQASDASPPFVLYGMNTALLMPTQTIAFSHSIHNWGNDPVNVVLDHTIIAFNQMGAAVVCGTSGSATLSCSDVYGNLDGDWTGCLAGQEVLNDKPPWDDMDKLWNHSPIKYIGNAKTPTMLIHSEHDHRCPIEQGEQAFVALKKLGVDTEMIRYPDEPHGLSRTGRTDRRISRLNHINRWFEKYLK